jgi:hypothetical protein
MKWIVLLLVLAAAPAAAASAAAPPPSTDPYTASLAYAECMRAHGVPHPNPDRTGDFQLTPADERRMREIPQARRKAADKACFYTLKGLDNRPLTPQAQSRALGVLREVARCMLRRGHAMGTPVVKNMSRGRAFFGFKGVPRGAPDPSLMRDELACEKRVGLARKIDKIIAADRSHL